MANLSNLGGNYALGLTNPPSSLESLGVVDPHPGELTPFAETVGLAGSGKQIQLGRPVAKWHWGMITQLELHRLLTFCSGGTQRVFITTRVPSGVVPTYTTFRALMHYPTQMVPKPGGLWADVDILFTDLQNA